MPSRDRIRIRPSCLCASVVKCRRFVPNTALTHSLQLAEQSEERSDVALADFLDLTRFQL